MDGQYTYATTSTARKAKNENLDIKILQTVPPSSATLLEVSPSCFLIVLPAFHITTWRRMIRDELVHVYEFKAKIYQVTKSTFERVLTL